MRLHPVLELQRTWFMRHRNPELAERRDSIHRLLAAMDRHEDSLLEALSADLGKPPVEAYMSEIRPTRDEALHALLHLKRWMKPRRCSTPLVARPGTARVVRDPCGCVLILSPWNYPLHLAITPLIGVLAAGCTAVLKTSEQAPATAAVLGRMLGDAFEPGQVSVIHGEGEVGEKLSREPFDHIFFTGSHRIGKKVLAAAAEHLVPVTLELGGKCPVLYFPDEANPRDLETVARRIAWGKHLNAGQTCVAPDHLMARADLVDPLVESLGRAFDGFGRSHYSRMISRVHFDRVSRFLEEGRIAYGGDSDAATLTIGPTVMVDVPDEASSMSEEIFGPALPIIPFEDLDQALDALDRKPAPLAIYAFGSSKSAKSKILGRTSSGSVCFNDTVLQIAGPGLPFGGIGASGMGRYRGEASFLTFTRQRGILDRHLGPEFHFRYPPPKASLSALRSFFRTTEKIRRMFC